jgi:type IV pilus assembly protein PilM
MSALSIFKHIFPPPTYITLPNVGVDISDTSLKYVQFRRHHARDKNLELLKWGDIDIPAGAVERGTIKDVDTLSRTLNEVSKACDTEYVRLSLPEERAYLFETLVEPDTPFKEIRGLLEFKLEENVPLSPRDAYFDYDIVERADDTGELLVSVAVYAKDTINNYYEACIKAGLVPLSFEVEAQAIARAVIPKEDGNTCMIIDFGKTRTGIGIVHCGSLMYTSTIDIGGDTLSQAMRDVLGSLPEDEYSKIKNEKGLLNTEGNKVYEALCREVSEIKKEIETRIQYWQTRAGATDEREIHKLVLCGGSSNLAGLAEYLENTLSIETVHGEVWQNAFSVDEYVPPITHRYSYGYATAIGLALKDFVTYD